MEWPRAGSGFGADRSIQRLGGVIVLSATEPLEGHRAMITCFIRYQIDPLGLEAFDAYARGWGQAIPRCGADLVGYFAPHEGSATTAYGVYHVESLAAYEAYRARLRDDPLGRQNYELARKERFIVKEERLFLRLASAPHVPLVRP